MKIGVIGAGIAGLSAARYLTALGFDVQVIDKGRGIGGRCATRRTERGAQFDHGAQYVTARGANFAKVLRDAETAGAAAVWSERKGKQRWVGTPGMSSLAKFLGAGLTVHQSVTATAIRENAGGVEIETADGPLAFDLVICTVPAPQAIGLLGPDHALSDALHAVEYAPCLTLLAEVSGRPVAPDSEASDGEMIGWLARNSSKPGRPEACWVAHASPEWSQAHLELGREEIAAKLLPEFCRRVSIDADSVTYTDAHRWRYASVTRPLGAPYLKSSSGRLYLGGDWCLAARVEAAFDSGLAVAQEIAAQHA